jgi:DNA repair protein RadC
MKTRVLREQLQQYGVQTFSNEELLALIFCTESTTERMQILKKIQKLFAACNDLQGVLCADFGEICLAHGLGEHKAAQLQAVLEFAKRLAAQSPTKKYQIRSVDDAASLVKMEMMYLDHEEFRVLVLDTKNQVVANLCLYQGTVNSSLVRVAEVLRPAIARKAPKTSFAIITPLEMRCLPQKILTSPNNWSRPGKCWILRCSTILLSAIHATSA